VRALQHTLYRTAKTDTGRRFHALGDKIIRSDVLMRAWFQVYRNQGASGVDRITVDQVKEYGVTVYSMDWPPSCGRDGIVRCRRVGS
jgi:RNA-directed DNA polymerase